MPKNRKWSDLTQAQKRTIVVAGVVETALTVYGLLDLRRRDRAAIRGPKAAWLPALFVQPFGPLAYLLWGRHGGR